MKFSYLICCLILHLSQHANGIFFSSSWLQNFLNPTTTTTPTPSAGVPSQSFFNISPQIYLTNDVAGTTAYSNLILAIGQNISGISRRKRSFFEQVFDKVDNGISQVKKGVKAFTDPVKKRLARRRSSTTTGESNSRFVSGKGGSLPKINVSGQASFGNSSELNSKNEAEGQEFNDESTTNANSAQELEQSQPQPSEAAETNDIDPDSPRRLNLTQPSNGSQNQTNKILHHTDDIKNRASNFLSGLQDRFANSPIAGYVPTNTSHGSHNQYIKHPINDISNRINKTNYLQNFTDGVNNFVDQLASNNPDIHNFITNNNVNTSNPFHTFAELGQKGLIPNPVEILANLSMDHLENKVKDHVNNGLSNVQNGVYEAQTFGSKLINFIPNLAANAIKDIQNMINLSGVVSCVNKQPLPFSNVIQVAAKSASKCVAEKVDQAANIWNNTADNLRNASNDLQNLRDSINDCSQQISSGSLGLSLSDAMALNTCYAAALINVQSETILLPITIGQRIAEGVDWANSLKGYMVKCVANLAQDIATQAFKASQAIAKCIVDSTG